MSRYQCPLCKQAVSKSHYEEITGIWHEKETKLRELSRKEKELSKKERELKKLLQKQRLDLQRKYESAKQREIRKQEKLFKQAQKNERKLWKEQVKNIQQKAEVNAKRTIEEQRRKIEKTERRLKDKNEKLLQQFRSQQTKHQVDLNKRELKIKSLEEQLKKNQTPQVLGLLEEKVFLSELKKAFPNDLFEHTGKKGDIVHYIFSGGEEVGCIVYELKKVAKFDKKHVEQTLKARNCRQADYGILVTNAKRSKTDIGFSTNKDVLIIHPAGAIVLIKILRDHLIRLSKLKLSSSKRNKSVVAILKYIQGADFKNSIESIIQHTVDLYENMQDEVNKHVKAWKYRLDKYRNIHQESHLIQHNIFKKRIPGVIEPIEMPKQIK